MSLDVLLGWNRIGFELEFTMDGSPTLRLWSPPQPQENSITSDLGKISPENQSTNSQRRPESMHHSGGAFSETNLIYGAVIRQVLSAYQNPRFCIVGLGLGYIEILLAAEARRLKKKLASVYSFESVLDLETQFEAWTFNEKEKMKVDWSSSYDQILQRTSDLTSVSPQEIKEELKLWFVDNKIVRPGALSRDWVLSHQYEFQGIMYDAFSSHTTQELWSEDFLNLFLQHNNSSVCMLSTYACLGNLKRALKNQNYEIEVLPGFQGKRNSTRAHKGF